jgi:hypothetical protein
MPTVQMHESVAVQRLITSRYTACLGINEQSR